MLEHLSEFNIDKEYQSKLEQLLIDIETTFSKEPIEKQPQLLTTLLSQKDGPFSKKKLKNISMVWTLMLYASQELSDYTAALPDDSKKNLCNRILYLLKKLWNQTTKVTQKEQEELGDLLTDFVENTKDLHNAIKLRSFYFSYILLINALRSCLDSSFVMRSLPQSKIFKAFIKNEESVAQAYQDICQATPTSPTQTKDVVSANNLGKLLQPLLIKLMEANNTKIDTINNKAHVVTQNLSRLSQLIPLISNEDSKITDFATAFFELFENVDDFLQVITALNIPKPLHAAWQISYQAFKHPSLASNTQYYLYGIKITKELLCSHIETAICHLAQELGIKSEGKDIGEKIQHLENNIASKNYLQPTCNDQKVLNKVLTSCQSLNLPSLPTQDKQQKKILRNLLKRSTIINRLKDAIFELQASHNTLKAKCSLIITWANQLKAISSSLNTVIDNTLILSDINRMFYKAVSPICREYNVNATDEVQFADIITSLTDAIKKEELQLNSLIKSLEKICEGLSSEHSSLKLLIFFLYNLEEEHMLNFSTTLVKTKQQVFIALDMLWSDDNGIFPETAIIYKQIKAELKRQVYEQNIISAERMAFFTAKFSEQNEHLQDSSKGLTL